MDRIRVLEYEKRRAEDEIEAWKRSFTELEKKNLWLKQVELQKVELEKAFEVCMAKYEGLAVEFRKKKMECTEIQGKLDVLMVRKISVRDELMEYKRMCTELKQRILHLEEDQKIICEREKKEQDRIMYLEEENKDLECGKRKAENEIEVWKKRVKIDVDDELNNYQKICKRLKEWISHLDEDKKVICEREKRAQERIAYLEDKSKKKESDGSEKYVQLKTENRDLECGKRRAEDEIEVWKKRFRELETQVLTLKPEVQLEKVEMGRELEVCRTKCHELSVELEEKKMDCVSIEDKFEALMLQKIAVDDELKECKTMCNGQREHIICLGKDQNLMCGREKRAQERITHLSKELKKKESDESEKYVQLKTENRDLECRSKRAEDEIGIWKKRFKELETQSALRMKQVELEKSELKAYISKCHGLSVELEENKMECVMIEGKLKDLLLRNIAVDDELKEYKTTCNGMKERIMGLEEDQKVICEKEKRAQERITFLEEEIKKMESDGREMYVQLKTENRDLECGKIRAEDEVVIWKNRFKQLEIQVLRLEEENSTLRCIGSDVSGKIELEPGGLLNKVSYHDEGEKHRNKKLQSETDCEIDSAHLPHLKIKKMLYNNEKFLTSAFAGCNQPSSLQGKRDVHITVPASLIMQSKPLVNVKEENRNTPLESKAEVGSRVRQQLFYELEGSSTKKLALLEQDSVRPASGGIVDISYCQDKKEITPMHACNIKLKETVRVSTDNTSKRSSDNEKYLTCKNCLKRPCSDLRGEEYWNSCEEDITLSSTPKLRRASKTVTCERESEDDDRIPIGKLKMKKLEELNEGVHKLSPLNQFAGNVTLSSGGQNVEDSISPSRRRLISLRQCEEKKNWGERTSRNESTSPNHLQMSGISNQKVGNPTSKNEKENVVEDVSSHSEHESLGGIIVKWSDSSDSGDSSTDSEDSRGIDLAFNQVIAMIKRNRVKELKWQFEADMLSSFEEDSELCMKAVCAIYRQQSSEKKSMKGALHSNNQGFNKYDALRGTTLAEFLMDGNCEGDLKKSVKELEMFDPKALEECKKLARHYSKQLFTIYKNKEDPFFLPSSTGRSDQTANSGTML